ncbi:MAG: PKD domain-containing protein [Bacteroidota bacterium]
MNNQHQERAFLTRLSPGTLLMRNNILFILLLVSSSMAFCQKNDHNWMFGYGLPGNPLFGVNIMNFGEPSSPTIEHIPEISFFFMESVVSMSDHEGDLLFYTNGVVIEDISFDTMQNGQAITNADGIGSLIPQGALALPVPEDEGQYLLLHEERTFDDELSIVAFETEYSIIDMEGNNGLGEVTVKKQTILSDTLEDGKLQAVRHANGRDWWVLKRKEFVSSYYKMLLSPEGLSVVDSQQIGEPLRTGLGQAVFSPDGKYYVQFNSISQSEGAFIDIYEFVRCSGELHEIERIHYDENASSGGAAFSPNSRFLYISFHSKIYQFDLWADNIEASRETVAVYDGAVDPLPTRFYLCQLAPDGKIYISVPNGVFSLHVIHFPDKKGLACQVEQRGVELPTFNATSMPNFPNYRLGPLDGSPCDTLGLDNIPVAKYRYEQDSTEYLQVEFTDLSYYEPAEWSWDFGDNTVSQDTSPVHTFPQDGAYEVCLTVSNNNGQHTHCRILELGTVSSFEEIGKADITVFPNPCREGVNIIVGDYLPRDANVVLYNSMGQRQIIQSVQTGWNTLQLDDLRLGFYFYEIWEGNVLLDSGKLVKVE